jgi:hypothetical protein
MSFEGTLEYLYSEEFFFSRTSTGTTSFIFNYDQIVDKNAKIEVKVATPTGTWRDQNVVQKENVNAQQCRVFFTDPLVLGDFTVKVIGKRGTNAVFGEIVFCKNVSGISQMFFYDIETGNEVLLSDNPNANYFDPYLSSDSSKIVFVSNRITDVTQQNRFHIWLADVNKSGLSNFINLTDSWMIAESPNYPGVSNPDLINHIPRHPSLSREQDYVIFAKSFNDNTTVNPQMDGRSEIIRVSDLAHQTLDKLDDAYWGFQSRVMFNDTDDKVAVSLQRNTERLSKIFYRDDSVGPTITWAHVNSDGSVKTIMSIPPPSPSDASWFRVARNHPRVTWIAADTASNIWSAEFTLPNTFNNVTKHTFFSGSENAAFATPTADGHYIFFRTNNNELNVIRVSDNTWYHIHTAPNPTINNFTIANDGTYIIYSSRITATNHNRLYKTDVNLALMTTSAAVLIDTGIDLTKGRITPNLSFDETQLFYALREEIPSVTGDYGPAWSEWDGSVLSNEFIYGFPVFTGSTGTIRPSPSPDGSEFVYLRGGTIVVADTAGTTTNTIDSVGSNNFPQWSRASDQPDPGFVFRILIADLDKTLMNWSYSNIAFPEQGPLLPKIFYRDDFGSLDDIVHVNADGSSKTVITIPAPSPSPVVYFFPAWYSDIAAWIASGDIWTGTLKLPASLTSPVQQTTGTSMSGINMTPDGAYIFSMANSNEIWLIRTGDSTVVTLHTGPNPSIDPYIAVHPSGAFIIYSSPVGAVNRLYQLPVDLNLMTAGPEVLIDTALDTNRGRKDLRFSPDGATLIYASREILPSPTGVWTITRSNWTGVALNSEFIYPPPVTNLSNETRYPSFSPDGTEFTYTLAGPSVNTILRADFNGTAANTVDSSGVNIFPFWSNIGGGNWREDSPSVSPDGTRIVYIENDQQMKVAGFDWSTGTTPTTVGNPSGVKDHVAIGPAGRFLTYASAELFQVNLNTGHEVLLFDPFLGLPRMPFWGDLQ